MTKSPPAPRPFVPAAAVGIAVAAIGLFAPAAFAQTTVTFNPVRDATIYETYDIFERANGSGFYFFVGRTNQETGSRRRGVLKFDLSSIPQGATITSATLRLHVSRTTGGTQTLSLRKVLADWGEGASDAEANEGAGVDPEPGDTTWLYRFFPDVLWSTPGGQYSTTQSASRSVAGINNYTWGSTAGMVADVQSWVDAPAKNFGWAVVNNNEGSARTAKRFDSRENDTPSFRPLLTVIYTPPALVCIADFNDDGIVNSTDVSDFINQWFQDQLDGTLITDWDGNGVVNSTDVSSFINDWFAAPIECTA